MRWREIVLTLAMPLASSACTLHHSKQALYADGAPTPSEEATFVTAEDSGLMLFGFLQVSEPDHYAVLIERLRRKHNCRDIHHAQLDFYTDHWLIVAFPIARVTMLCEGAPEPFEPAVREETEP